MKDARIIFMGTPVFGQQMLQTLLDCHCNVVAVVSQLDKAVGRKQIITYSPVKQLALEYNIPVIQPAKIKEEYQEILDYQPDMIITCAYGQIIPKVLLDAPKLGCINIHASLLPKLRGGAPIQHAIIDGYQKTGVTIMEMVPKMDAGDMIYSKEVKIEENDNYGSLHDKLIQCGRELLEENIDNLISGNYQKVAQDENEVTFGFNISKEEEHIDLTKSYQEVVNQIRGLSPEPCCYGIVDNKKIKFCTIEKTDEQYEAVNGTIIFFGKELGLVIDNRIIKLKEVQLEGKGKMNSKDFRNGAGRNWDGKIAQ